MQPAHTPNSSSSGSAPQNTPALSPAERVALCDSLLNGEICKEWTFDDHVVSLSATTSGYAMSVRGMVFKGNNRQFSFELDQHGTVVNSEGRMQIGCLVKKAAAPSESELDATLRKL